MKTKFFLSALAVAAMCSCNNEAVDCGQSGNVNPIITTNLDAVSSRTTEGFTEKTTFSNGDAMGVFLYKGSFGTSYTENMAVNNKATFDGTKTWTLGKTMYLTSDKGKLWAYYPYSESVTDGKAIPVDVTSNNVDYMYGSTVKDISIAYPYATIDMNHAMSQFVFRLKNSPEYSLEGKVTNIKLKASSTIFYQKGNLDITTGTITGSETSKTELAWVPKSTQLESDTYSDYKALVIPVSFNAKQVTLFVTIDGVEYKYDFEQTNWEKGKRYIYTFTLTGNGLIIGPDPEDPDGEYGQGGVKIEPWGESENGDLELTPVN